MNPTTIIIILSILCTSLVATLIFNYRNNKILITALKQELAQRQSDIAQQKEVVQTNKEITLEELKNNRKELDKIIKSLTKIQAEKVTIEEVKSYLLNL